MYDHAAVRKGEDILRNWTCASNWSFWSNA